MARSTIPLTIVEPDDLRRLAKSLIPVGLLLGTSALLDIVSGVVTWNWNPADPTSLTSNPLWLTVSIVGWTIDLLYRLCVIWMLLKDRCRSYPPSFQYARLLSLCALLELAFFLPSVRQVTEFAAQIPWPAYAVFTQIAVSVLYFPVLAMYFCKLARAADAKKLARVFVLAMCLLSGRAVLDAVMVWANWRAVTGGAVTPVSPVLLEGWISANYAFGFVRFAFAILPVLLARHIRRVVIPEAVRLRESPDSHSAPALSRALPPAAP